jgi:zinc protease
VTKNVMVTLLVGCILLHFYLYPLCPPQAAGSKPGVTSFKLSNGLRVILSPLEGVEATCVLLYHLTGVRDDPPEIRGASYLYQNLMLLGTQNTDNYDRILFLKRNGGISDMIVNYDYSIFFQLVPASEIDIDNALWLESERITSLRLSSRNITQEKNYVYTKNYHRFHSSVQVRASEWVKSKLFAGSIYETPIYGKLEEIRGFNNLAVKGIYNRFRNLSDVIMVISGKFDIPTLRKSIAKYFGELPSMSMPRPANNAKKSYSSLPPGKEFVYENWLEDNLPGPFVIYGIPGPSKFNLDHLYFDFIRYYLVDERISKLDEILNREHNLDVTIGFEIIDYFEASALIINVSSQRRPNLERAKYFITKKLDSLYKGTLSQSEVKTTKSLMEIDFMKKMTALDTRCEFLAETYHLSGELGGSDNHLRRIRRITTYDIFRIARKYLQRNNRVNLNVYEKK